MFICAISIESTLAAQGRCTGTFEGAINVLLSTSIVSVLPRGSSDIDDAVGSSLDCR